ncbi:uncharacterized protein LODBEIA_P15990 [Lodderomyces beijingensis]|uniref:DNA replication regulator SLD2 n=1 Tax=Lodderomyces beijingensis TaxID=1775926 RepID=A0ABP0ZGT0_9ASCO
MSVQSEWNVVRKRQLPHIYNADQMANLDQSQAASALVAATASGTTTNTIAKPLGVPPLAASNSQPQPSRPSVSFDLTHLSDSEEDIALVYSRIFDRQHLSSESVSTTRTKSNSAGDCGVTADNFTAMLDAEEQDKCNDVDQLNSSQLSNDNFHQMDFAAGNDELDGYSREEEENLQSQTSHDAVDDGMANQKNAKVRSRKQKNPVVVFDISSGDDDSDDDNNNDNNNDDEEQDMSDGDDEIVLLVDEKRGYSDAQEAKAPMVAKETQHLRAVRKAPGSRDDVYDSDFEANLVTSGESTKELDKKAILEDFAKVKMPDPYFSDREEADCKAEEIMSSSTQCDAAGPLKQVVAIERGLIPKKRPSSLRKEADVPKPVLDECEAHSLNSDEFASTSSKRRESDVVSIDFGPVARGQSSISDIDEKFNSLSESLTMGPESAITKSFENCKQETELFVKEETREMDTLTTLEQPSLKEVQPCEVKEETRRKKNCICTKLPIAEQKVKNEVEVENKVENEVENDVENDVENKVENEAENNPKMQVDYGVEDDKCLETLELPVAKVESLEPKVRSQKRSLDTTRQESAESKSGLAIPSNSKSEGKSFNKENDPASPARKMHRKRIASKPLSAICNQGLRSRVGLSKRTRIDSLHENIKRKSGT